mmetsp:Transcript_45121/g.139191  ORF Transcript_45121/g.139191 Transcript_45121/m.139191 type:complete len:103 (-) Transcript_45121:200-508(-)
MSIATVPENGQVSLHDVHPHSNRIVHCTIPPRICDDHTHVMFKLDAFCQPLVLGSSDALVRHVLDSGSRLTRGNEAGTQRSDVARIARGEIPGPPDTLSLLK